jgi:hypothetical protein
MTLRGQLEAQIPAAASPRDRSNAKGPWKNEITRTFMEAADDLKGVTEQEILDEIKRHRAERKKNPKVP